MRKPPFTTRVDIVRSNPFVATLTFEMDYLHFMVRVSRDLQSGKYWVQGGRLAAFTVKAIADIDPTSIAAAICQQAHIDRSDGMGGAGVVVYAMADGKFCLKETRLLAPEDIREFALHVIGELDKRYVPSVDEVARAVEDGLIEIGEAA